MTSSTRIRWTVAAAVVVLMITAAAVLWFLVVVEVANDQRTFLNSLYKPAVNIALKQASGALVTELPVRHGNCKHFLGEKCLEVVFAPEIQQDSVKLKALLEAVMRPCLALSSDDALTTLEEYQLAKMIRRTNAKSPVSSAEQIRVAARKAAKEELEYARVLANVADSCGARSNNRGGLILQLVFQGYAGSGAAKFVLTAS